MFKEAGLNPPKKIVLDRPSFDRLLSESMMLTEMQEEFFLLSHKPFKKIKVPKVLSWDLTGHPDQKIVRIGTEERRFELLDDTQGRKMIRIAPHPRDPHKVFKEQVDMIRELEDQDYTNPLYSELIPKLQVAPYTVI